MIKIVNSCVRLIRQPRYAMFDWLKKKPEEVKDDSQYDPANWKSLQVALENLKEKNQNKPRLLPIKKKQYQDKLTVVMEMDEVLLYSFVPDEKEMFMTAPLRNYDHYIELPEYDYFVHVYKREHLDKFMKYFLNETEPVIWSKGNRSYVEKVMAQICPEFPKEHIFCQEECTLVEEDDLEDFVKDVDLLGRDKKRLVYIDSKPISFWTFGDNCILLLQLAIPVKLFVADNTESKDDLLKLMSLLEKLRKEEDVRTYLRSKFRVEDTLRETKYID